MENIPILCVSSDFGSPPAMETLFYCLLGMGMRMRIHAVHAVHADDAHMRICASRCACKNLDAHQPHTKEKMSHFEETLNKIEDGRWLPCYVCFSYIHLI